MSNTTLLFFFFIAFLVNLTLITSQKPCPSCGSLEIPYPLSTDQSCGEKIYSSLRCDRASNTLYFEALNKTSYKVLKINPQLQRLVISPSPWIQTQKGDECETQDMESGEGLWLNRSLPFNVTSSNTIFLFNCSPRLLVSPLNCTKSSLCQAYLEQSVGHVGSARAARCAGGGGEIAGPTCCCTFVAGGMPSAYKIRLHRSGCRAFRSVIRLDEEKPAREWEEGLEIQWAPPVCERGYRWDYLHKTCVARNRGFLNYKLLGLEVTIGVFSISCLVVGLVVFGVRKIRSLSSEEREEMLSNKSAKMFGLKEMRRATKGFSKDLILGTGGFGEVYRGELRDGTVVAVKSAKVGNVKSKEQVLNEVDILSQVNHKNLVKLLGCCVDSKQPLMVYEYVSNGTLHSHLHDKFPSFLDWKTRLKIALQTAEALAYLHSSAHTPIFHRDVKSTNILLDDDLNAKVADFGLSRLASPGLSHISTCAQGTLGYLDPEYYRNYQLSDKSDVYSYGVVLLELLTSQNAIDFSRNEEDINLAIYARDRTKNGSVMEIVDRRLFEEDNCDDMLKKSLEMFLELSLSCLSEKKSDRPFMRNVVQELQCIIQIVNQDMCN